MMDLESQLNLFRTLANTLDDYDALMDSKEWLALYHQLESCAFGVPHIYRVVSDTTGKEIYIGSGDSISGRWEKQERVLACLREAKNLNETLSAFCYSVQFLIEVENEEGPVSVWLPIELLPQVMIFLNNFVKRCLIASFNIIHTECAKRVI